MNRTDYNRMTERELVGRYVAAGRDMQNSTTFVAKGTVLKITRKFGGFDLTAQPCKHCGLGVRITRVEPEAVDLLPANFKPRR